MRTDILLGPWIRRFLLEFIPGERGLSANTQSSYRDTFRLFFVWAEREIHKSPDKFEVADLSADLLRSFLNHLEQERKCEVATRNQRLAAFHALARFIEIRGPEYITWSGSILAIPFKRSAKPALGYLEKAEMDAILAAPDRRSPQGNRDYAILLFLYNTGARASEASHLACASLHLDSSPAWVKIRGKWQKERICPLWPATVRALAPLAEGRDPAEPVFRNQRRQPLTRFGIRGTVRRAVARAMEKSPSLRSKRVGAHTIRHTTAVHLVSAGVDINTIREWLGHTSLETTNIYAEVALDVKERALAHVEIKPRRGRGRCKDRSLMDFLRTLHKRGELGGRLCGLAPPKLSR